jgi:Ran GTPase-activating protein (RanGAP) involved in mRNA processing and transport
MPEVVEDLFRAPLGGALRGVHLHAGYESTRELIDAINTAGPLERLSFSVMGITAEYARQLFAGPAASALKEFSLRNEPLGEMGMAILAYDLPASLLDLTLDQVGVQPEGLESLARSDRIANLRRLNLSRNSLPPRAMRVLSLSRPLAGLRSLHLQNCNVGDKGVRHLTRSKFWLNLVELDLRQNPISPAGVKHLLNAPLPPDLTALVLDREAFGGDSRSALAKKYGDAVVFAASEVPG